jgi:proteasome accessory factor B
VERLERLINLVAALLAAERPLTRAELRERVPGYPPDDRSFRRAFERDKDAMRRMGIPISLEPLDPSAPEQTEGYRVPREQYELPDPGLDRDELAALHLAMSAVRLEGAQPTAAIWKLGGAAGDGEPSVPGQAEAAAPADVALGGSEHLPFLFACVGERRPVRFLYRGEERTVDAWRLAFRSGRWYVTGWDHGRADERQFRLDRLADPRPAGEAGAFERPAGGVGAPPPPWEMGDEEPVSALLLVDADQAEWALGHLGPEAVAERRADGSMVFRLRVTNRAAFRSLVVGFLDRAEVLGPAELRDDLVAWLEALAGAGASG